MKTAAQAAAAYVANGSAPTAVSLWATDYNAAYPTMITKATAAIPLWQSQVSTAQAATNMKNGLAKAANKAAVVAAKVSGAGSASFAAGVRAAGGPGGDYTAFIGPWMSAVGGEVQTLNTTNPRGTRQQNRARQAAYDAWVDSQAGNFRVK
jgi:hypothetical protein